MDLDINDLNNLVNSDDYEYLRKIFNHLKSVNDNNNEYLKYINCLLKCRDKMKINYICDTILDTYLINDKAIKNIINKTIYKVLKYFGGIYKDINELDMTNNCTGISLYVEKISKEERVECELKDIWPAYSRDEKIYGNRGFHYFNILEIDNKKYLVDLTYKQFFKCNYCLEEEIGVPLLCAPLPGFFMMIDEERKKVAKEILNKGYIELKNNVLKHYCDGFTLSYRNKNYYNIHGYDYTTTYKDEDYYNFLNGVDNQINHESIKCIGSLRK